MNFEALKEIVSKRSTSKDYSGEPISKKEIESLLDLAVRAPNHHLNEPWRFVVCGPKCRDRWLQALESKISPEEFAPLKKARDKLLKAGAIIFVLCQRSENPVLHEENYAAVSSAIQSILLGATALNLLSYWSTNKICLVKETQTFFEFGSDERLAGAIWLGRGTAKAPSNRTPAQFKTRWMDDEWTD